VVFLPGAGRVGLDYLNVHDEVWWFTTSVLYDRAGTGWSEEVELPRTATEVTDELRGILGAAARRRGGCHQGQSSLSSISPDTPSLFYSFVLTRTRAAPTLQHFCRPCSGPPRGPEEHQHQVGPHGLPGVTRGGAPQPLLRRALYRQGPLQASLPA
jgi:hypothetical protein